MNYETARWVKWDIVDNLLCSFTESEMYNDYSDEQREYANAVIRRIAANLKVTNHIYL